MKIRKKHSPTILLERIDDEAGDLVSLYVHDDGLSPYFRADLVTIDSELLLRLNLLDDAGNSGWNSLIIDSGSWS